jgi:hypothetical protein
VKSVELQKGRLLRIIYRSITGLSLDVTICNSDGPLHHDRIYKRVVVDRLRRHGLTNHRGHAARLVAVTMGGARGDVTCCYLATEMREE